jgi:hypothetical protein
MTSCRVLKTELALRMAVLVGVLTYLLFAG